MSSARDIINAPGSAGWLPRMDFSTLRRKCTMYFHAGLDWSKVGSRIGTSIGWWLVTSAIITALPLVMEFNREFQVEELERLTISDAIENQGMSPLDLKRSGLGGAVNPEVLAKGTSNNE
jgi:hypothetical protein